MDALPFELKDGILRLLQSLDNTKAIRLVNRHFRDLATPILFRHLHLTVRTESFDRLTQICDSELSRHVRSLHYNIREIPLILERDWDRAVQKLPRRRTDGRQMPIPQYQDYHDCCRSQVLHDEYNLLTKAFQRLPSLRSLEISEHSPPPHLAAAEPEMLSNVTRILDLATAFPHGYIPSDRAWAVSGKISRPLNMILAHAAVNHGTLECLTLDGFRWQWLDMRDVRMWHEEEILKEALGALRRLRISVSGFGEEDVDVPDLGAAVQVWRGLIGLADVAGGVEIEVGGGL